MATNFSNSMPRQSLAMNELEKRVDYPKITITGKNMDDSKKEYLDI